MMEKTKHKMLIVDDDELNIIALTHMLGSEFTVYEVKNGKEAIGKAEEIMPDIILLDILMSEMDGYEVIAALNKNPKTKEIPVIFISGLNNVENEEKGLALGAVDYIIKPFSPAIVRLRINKQIRILEQIRAIEQLNAEVQDAAKAKSAFLAMMSHEMRTPMNAVLGITEILMQSSALSPEVEDGLNKIHNSCDLLLGLINDILDFSKIDAGKLDITPSQYYVASFINDSVQLNLMRIGSKLIEFELNVDENIPAALIGDELRVKQILNNILSNAFKYTEKGKVTLTIVSEKIPGKKEEMLILSVRDTGLGMTKQQIDNLFLEYSRFIQSHKRPIEGTGLGLAITQRLLKLMDGEIFVESVLGKGSVFTMRLPQGIVGHEVLGKEVVDNLKKFQNHKSVKKRLQIVREFMPYGSILVVDDVETNLDVAVGLMKPYGLKIETVMSGMEAIDKVKSGKKYDIIFMDHMMPEMDGIEASKQLKSMGYTNPIVMLTANAIVGQSEMFLQEGFDAFLSKPIDIRQLNVILNKFVRDRQPAEVIKTALHQQNISAVDISEDSQMNILLRESFIKDAKKALATFDELYKNNGFDTEEGLRLFSITVHGMKSSLGNVKEAALSETACNLEKAGKEKDSVFIKAEILKFADNLASLLKSMEANKVTDSNISEDPPDLRDKLLEIQKNCVEYDRKGVLDLITEIKTCTKETRQVLEDIKEKVRHSEYEEAEESIGAYIAFLNTNGKGE